MKKLLLILSLLLLPVSAFADNTALFWERLAYGSLANGITYVRLVGSNGGPTTTWEALWKESAAYTPLLVAMSAPYCASSDANDTAAGTGARTIRVSGINTSFARFTETVTMNGQTSVVLTTSNVQFIDKIEVLTTGSGLLNAGIIQCGTGANTAGDPAVTHAYLTISSATVATSDGNQSEMFFYAVPASYKLLCHNFVASSVMATAANVFQVVLDTYTNNDIRKRVAITMGEAGGGNPSTNPGFVIFPEKTIIVGQVQGASGAAIQLTADCALIADPAAGAIGTGGQGIF